MAEHPSQRSTRLRLAWLPDLIAAALAAASALAALVPASCADPARAEPPLRIEVERVPLDPTTPERQRVGALLFRGGLWLRSADRRFGGLSDLRVSPDGSRLYSVSDCGYGLSATLTSDGEGRLSGLADARLVELVGEDGEQLPRDERDAESLVIDRSALEVGFEGANRILAYDLEPPFAGPARRVGGPAGLRHCEPNGGIETMTLLADGRRLLVCEKRKRASLDTLAWIGRGDDWSERSYPLLFEGVWGGEPFRPTSAARLPGGDVLVLERRFPPIGARLLRIAREDLADRTEAGARLRPREIARFEKPLTLDNLEGVEVRPGRDRTLVYLVSDDNNCAKRRNGPRGTGLQRTLLLMFALTD